ncbi:MAG: CHASE2 domain-containing protein [Pseudomonadota bacterium]
MITGRIASRRQRFLHGLWGVGMVLAILLPLLFSGRLNLLEHRGLDWLQRHISDKSRIRDDIVIVYIDQRSLDYYLRAFGRGWPWPRDIYGLVASFLSEGGARAVVFDAIMSEPSVFAKDFDDDNALAGALSASGRAILSLVLHQNLFHEYLKPGAVRSPEESETLDELAALGLRYERTGGPAPVEFQDLTPPMPILRKAAWGLGFIGIEPEADGVVRRMRPLAGFRGQVYPTLALEAFLKTAGLDQAVQTADGLVIGGSIAPLDGEGQALIKYYGGEGAYRDYSFAALVKAALDRMRGEKPMVDPGEFKDKIVFIGAKAAGLWDLRSTPMAEDLPGVEIHAAFLNNILEGDFIRSVPAWIKTGVIILLLIATLCAAIFAPSALVGAGLAVLLSGLFLGAVFLAFRQNYWMEFLSPLGAQAGVFILATVVNYYGEGREKKAVKGAFSLYLSPQVVATVLEHPELLSLGGSRRVMSVFFSDLAGFTSISEALTPEDLVSLLNKYLSLMTENIMHWGGTVDKFEGDAIMAFWGAPLVQDDHAFRACNSALEQQKIMEGFRTKALAEGLPELRVRMGVNTGPMIVGNMGSAARFDYTVMGDSVNLASRLEGANKGYKTEIMISEFTYALVRDKFEVRELDLLRVKGKKEPIRVYELLARTGELSPAKVALRTAYETGLAHYRAMDFTKAEDFFSRALSLDPEDGPSQTYLARVKAYRETPPPPEWDRVFTLTTK